MFFLVCVPLLAAATKSIKHERTQTQVGLSTWTWTAIETLLIHAGSYSTPILCVKLEHRFCVIFHSWSRFVCNSKWICGRLKRKLGQFLNWFIMMKIAPTSISDGLYLPTRKTLTIHPANWSSLQDCAKKTLNKVCKFSDTGKNTIHLKPLKGNL